MSDVATDLTYEQLSEQYQDVLREIGNIGAGNATSALSNMLGLKIDMAVPRVRLLEFPEIGSALGAEDEIVVGIYLEVEGGIEGSMMFVFKMASAHFLANRLMGRPDDCVEEFSDMDLSALKEIGNIIGASYLSALATMTNMVISPSVPYLAIDMAASILSVPAIQFGHFEDQALFVDTEMGDEVTLEGFFILLADPAAYTKILKQLGILG
ncbi:CheY-P-specific phosphatase CheC [Clostridia bacterium]|nr:CheY-P-specific phosphatase CheC [Clostridia bacterium]